MSGCGHSKTRKYCGEDCAMDAHEYDHPEEDRLGHWQEEDCSICERLIYGDIEDGKRCHHGELIPWRRDPKFKSIETDIECPYCQIDYGPTHNRITNWAHIQEQELDRMISTDIEHQKHGV